MASTTKTTTGKAKTANPEKSQPLDLSKAIQIDGALPTARTIDDLLGNFRTPYNTRDFDSYRRQLSGMQLYQLQTHAQKLGVLPGQNRAVCIQRLEDAFLKHQNRYRRTIAATRTVPTEEDKRLAEIRERAEQALRGGRIR